MGSALPIARLCAACGHVHGGRAYGLCLVGECPCIVVQAVEDDNEPDPWLLPRWRRAVGKP